MNEMRGDYRRMILHLLREGVGEPGDAAHSHPHGEVLPLYKRRTNVLGVTVAACCLHVAADALGWAVTLLRLVRRAANLLKLCIVNVDAQGILYGIPITLVAICR